MDWFQHHAAYPNYPVKAGGDGTAGGCDTSAKWKIVLKSRFCGRLERHQYMGEMSKSTSKVEVLFPMGSPHVLVHNAIATGIA